MFEQTFVDVRGSARGSWPVAVSLAGQVMFVGGILLLPLMNTARIAWQPTVIVWAPPRPVAPMPERVPVATKSASSQISLVQAVRNTFIVPRSIPRTLPTVGDVEPVPVLTLGGGMSAEAGIAALGSGMVMAASVGTGSGVAAVAKVETKSAPSMIRAGGSVQAAKLIHQVKPVYPALARAARVAGTVKLRAIIAKDGTIRDLQLINGPSLLVSTSIEAVRQWLYKATLLNGEAVEVLTEIDVNFTLNQ